jgi:hypothetical protein
MWKLIPREVGFFDEVERPSAMILGSSLARAGSSMHR